MRIYVNFDKNQSSFIINFDKIANSSSITSISLVPSVPRFQRKQLDLTGGEYYIDTNDFAESYSFEAYFEKPHINLSLYINHGIGLTECSLTLSHSFSYRPGIRRKFALLPEETFRQAFNLMLEFCHDRGAYTKFQDTLFAQVQALICIGK